MYSSVYVEILWPFFSLWTTRLGFLQRSSSGSANAEFYRCFRLLEYWINMLPSCHFTFPCRIFCRGFSGFATDCPCGVWCRVLTTCLLHLGPLFGNDSRFVRLTWRKSTFLYYFTSECFIIWYFILFYLIYVSQIMLHFLHSTSVLSFYIDLTLSIRLTA